MEIEITDILFFNSLIYFLSKIQKQYFHELKIDNIEKKDLSFLYNLEKQLKNYIKINKSNIQNFHLSDLTIIPEDFNYKCYRINEKNLLSFVKVSIQEFLLSKHFIEKEIPEIIDTQTAFDKLNMDINHPARSKTDTFYIDDDKILITQSSILEVLERTNLQNIPSNLFCISRVFRRDEDLTHSPFFHQLEIVSNQKNMLEFINIIKQMFQFIFHAMKTALNLNDINFNLTFNFRPHFFPFTYCSFEMDLVFQDEFIEVLGGGIFNIYLFPSEYNNIIGCGIGLERLSIIFYNILVEKKYQIKNIKNIYAKNIYEDYIKNEK